MLGRLRNSYAEIDLSRLEQNYLTLKKAGNGQLAPMVKADGYGHGDIQVARVCERLGARYLGVALLEEGIKLRLAGIQTPILAFCPFDSQGAEAIVKYRLTPALSDFGQIEKLKTVLHEQAAYPVHVKFNTGMQRLGFEPEDVLKIGAEFENESFLKLEGVCTHLVDASDYGQAEGHTAFQFKEFSKIREQIKKFIKTPLVFHIQNSSALLSGIQPAFDMARPGIALYGILPKMPGNTDIKLMPVLSVKSHVAFVHKVKKGDTVSYGATWKAPRDSVIAVVPVGYADGLPRSLSNKGHVLIHGEPCPITGIICMDYFMVDATAVVEKKSELLVGDEVVLIGTQKEKAIAVEELALLAGTIPYEILTGMRTRLARVYLH